MVVGRKGFPTPMRSAENTFPGGQGLGCQNYIFKILSTQSWSEMPCQRCSSKDGSAF